MIFLFHLFYTWLQHFIIIFSIASDRVVFELEFIIFITIMIFVVAPSGIVVRSRILPLFFRILFLFFLCFFFFKYVVDAEDEDSYDDWGIFVCEYIYVCMCAFVCFCLCPLILVYLFYFQTDWACLRAMLPNYYSWYFQVCTIRFVFYFFRYIFYI